MSEQQQGTGTIIFDAVTDETRQQYEQHLQALQERLVATPTKAAAQRAVIKLDMAEARIGLGEPEQAWSLAREAFDTLILAEQWQEAAEACEVLYQTGLEAAVVALAHGIWIGVTYPIKPQTTLTLLNYVIDETPPTSDGAAVAAAAAHYIAGVRASDEDYQSLEFLTRNMLVKVAERHSNVANQQELDIWMMRLELNDPQVFLPRLGKVLELIVLGQWWIDRDALRAALPVN